MTDTKYCQGCRDNFYNGINQMGITECWLLKQAEVVTRYQIGTWTRPMVPGAFTKIQTYNCYHEDGSSFYTREQLPKCAVEIRRGGGAL